MRTQLRRRHCHIRDALALILFSLAPFVLLLRYNLRLNHPSTSPARLAYFIQVSPTNLAVLPRLLIALYDPQNVYAIHLDRKIPLTSAHSALLAAHRAVGRHYGTGASQNVHNLLTVRSESVTYRGITMTINYLTGMNHLLAHGEWDFFINLSGADYPTASQRLMRVLLGHAKGCNFVEWKPRSTWQGFAERRLGQFYVDTGLGKLHGGESEYLDVSGRAVSRDNVVSVRNPVWDRLDFTVAKSSGWFILSRRFCEHLRGDADVRKMVALMAFSDASDEHFVASVLWNGGEEWRTSVVGSNLRSIFFVAPNESFAIGEGGVRSRQHPFWVDEVDEEGKFIFWEKLLEWPGFFTRKVRGENEGGGGGFRDRVDREMIGLSIGNTADSDKEQARKLRKYEQDLQLRFEQLLDQVSQHRQEFDDQQDWGY